MEAALASASKCRVEAVSEGAGRGLVATSAVGEGDALVVVPWECARGWTPRQVRGAARSRVRL